MNSVNTLDLSGGSTLIPIKPTMLSTRPASYIEYCIRSLRKLVGSSEGISSKITMESLPVT